MSSLFWFCVILAGIHLSFASDYKYELYIRTGGSLLAGTNAKVYIKIQGTNGITAERELNNVGKDDFERGMVDHFAFTDSTDVGVPYMIQFYRTDVDWGNWELDWVKVIYNKKEYFFKYDDWVDHSRWIDIKISGCPAGYELGSDNQCKDIDECKSKCLLGECVNTPGSYRCTCKSGYEQKGDQCVDIDECASDTDGCEQDCKNNDGSYECICSAGYIVNGTRCQNINECNNNPCKENTKCVDSIGSFACECKVGFKRKDGYSCVDINECNAPNKCDFSSSTCVNHDGGYSCKCLPGYTKISQYSCNDTDECTTGSHSCDSTTSQCANTLGDYFCKCNLGYHQEKSNKVCLKDKCGPLSKPYESVVTPSRCTDSTENYFGDVCTVTCNNGFELQHSNVNTIRCAAGGIWEGIPVCTRVRCPPLSPITNGKLLPSTCTTGGNTYQGQCSYICDNGYIRVGSPLRECLADKTWTGSKPTCIKVVVQPSVQCPNDIIVTLAQGQSTADVSALWKDPTYYGEILTVDPSYANAKYQYPAGINRVTWTARNSAGSASCSIMIIVNDKEAPKVSNCPTSPVAVLTTANSEPVTWTTPSFTDNVNVTKVTATHKSGDVFGIGSWNVYYTATDAVGNRAECNFEVLVKLKGCPVLSGPKFGSKTCSNFAQTQYCQPLCPVGKKIFENPSEYNFWSCASAAWTPTNHIPDCVDATLNTNKTPCSGSQVLMDIKTSMSIETYCADCPTGTYSSNGKCAACSPGQYQDQTGSSSCKQCPSGTDSVGGAADLNKCRAMCRAGHYSKDGMDPGCQVCPRDTYQTQPKSTSCIACPPGTTTLSTGTTRLKDCGVKSAISSFTPKTVTIDEGQSTSLSCIASGTPAPRVTINFRKVFPPEFLGKEQRDPIKDANGNTIGLKLTITGARYENSGHYECKAVNSFGIAVEVAQLTVNKVYVGSGGGVSMDEQKFL